jgi:hypothetical protein
MNSTQRMTRRQIAKYLREHGVPVGDSTLDKLCMPTVNEGPPVAVWWGRRPLYDPADALAWAEGRMRRDQNYTSRALKPLPVEQVNSSSDRRRKDNERAGAPAVMKTHRMLRKDALQNRERRGRGARRYRN